MIPALVGLTIFVAPTSHLPVQQPTFEVVEFLQPAGVLGFYR